MANDRRTGRKKNQYMPPNLRSWGKKNNQEVVDDTCGWCISKYMYLNSWMDILILTIDFFIWGLWQAQWPVSRECSILLGTWSHSWYIQRPSVFTKCLILEFIFHTGLVRLKTVYIYNANSWTQIELFVWTNFCIKKLTNCTLNQI